MGTQANRVDDFAATVAALACRPGRPFEGQEEVQAAHVRLLIAVSQFAVIAGPDDLLWGFVGWLRLDDRGLALVRSEGIGALMSADPLPRIDVGPHVHVSLAVVAPWAPRCTYRSLVALTARATRDVETKSFSTVFANRRGARTWRERDHL